MEQVLPRRLKAAPGPQALGRRARALANALRKPSRRSVLVAMLTAVVLAGGFLWFRSSSFVAVEHVQVQGVHGVDAGEVQAAILAAGKRMSTLNAGPGSLEAAVARFHVVRSIEVKASFPHTLRVSVTEQLPVAVLTAEGRQTAVAADGVALGSQLATGSLPHIAVEDAPRIGREVGSQKVRSYLTLLGAAPAPLLPFVTKIYEGEKGLTVKLRGGLLVYFGDDSRPHAKWASLAAVVADKESAGAVYIDVRLPERPVAGMQSDAEGEGSEGEVSAGDPTSAALAASLARAVNGESPIEATKASTDETTTESATTGEADTEPSSSEDGETALESDSTTTEDDEATTAEQELSPSG